MMPGHPTPGFETDQIVQVSEHPKTGVLGATFLLAATILGAGILTMPYQFYLVGIVPTTLLLVLVAVVNWYSIYMMVEAGDASKSESYEELAEKTMPGIGKYVNTVFIVILLFGALVAYVGIIAELLRGCIVGIISSPKHWIFDKYVMLLIFTILFMWPLCMLRNISKLELSSIAAVILIAFFTGVITVWGMMATAKGEVDFNGTIYWGFPKGGENGHPPILNSIFIVLPTITLAYGCQPNVFSIRSELLDNTRTRTNYVNIITTLICFLLYFCMGIWGYFVYPNQLPYQGNVLNAIPSNVFGTILRVFFLIAVLFHFPCVHFPLRNTIEVTFFSNYQFNWVRHTVMTTVVIGLSMIVSIQIPSLGKVFALTGSLAAFPVSFIIPALAYLRLVIFKKNDPVDMDGLINSNHSDGVSNPWLKSILPFGVIGFSLVSMVISIYTSINAFF